MNDTQNASLQLNPSTGTVGYVKGVAYDVDTIKTIILLPDVEEIKRVTGRTEASIKKIRFDFIHWEKGDVVDISPVIRQAFEELKANGQTIARQERKAYNPQENSETTDASLEDPFAEFEIITRTYINSVADLVERMATQMYVEKVESNIQRLRDEASQINFRKRFKSVRRINYEQSSNSTRSGRI